MKVLQINSVCGRGSTGRIATDIADILKEQGHECRIAYGRDTVPEKYKDIAVRIGSDWDVRLHGVQTRLFDAHGFGSTKATKRFLKWVERYDPDVIHLHNIHGYYINVELLFDYLKRAGKPVIWTLHDCWSFTGHCSHFTIAKCEQWMSHCAYCNQTKEYPKCALKSDVYRNFARKCAAFTGVEDLTLVTPSQWLADIVKQSFLKEYPVSVIPNGIDLSVFKPTGSNFRTLHGLQDKQILLGVASVWDKRKGLDDFIELSKMLREDQKIVLVGLSAEQLKSLPANVLGIQRTNSAQELAEIYSAADVFLNPTYEDNFPTTNLEALACGTPVITYRTGGSPEAVDDTCGIVVDNDPKALFSALEQVCFSEAACVQRAKNYDKQQRFLEYTELYKEKAM